MNPLTGIGRNQLLSRIADLQDKNASLTKELQDAEVVGRAYQRELSRVVKELQALVESLRKSPYCGLGGCDP